MKLVTQGLQAWLISRVRLLDLLVMLKCGSREDQFVGADVPLLHFQLPLPISVPCGALDCDEEVTVIPTVKQLAQVI